MKKDTNGMQTTFELYIPQDIRAGFETKKRIFKMSKKYGLLSKAIIASFLFVFGTDNEKETAELKIKEIRKALRL